MSDRPTGGRPRAVIFDLDGTLTVPVLDFDRIRAEIGVEGPVLEAVEALTGAARERAERILDDHEQHAARGSTLQPGAAEVLAELRRRGIPCAILTRNSRASLETVLSRHSLTADALRTREDGARKPSPAPVLDLCARLGVPPEETLVVGDYLFDLQAARSAGAVAVLLVDGDNRRFREDADHTIDDLREILELVRG